MSTPKKASKSKEINFDALLRAVKQILIENKGYRSTGRDFDLDFCLLKRHCKKLKDKFEDVSSVSDDKLMRERTGKNREEEQRDIIVASSFQVGGNKEIRTSDPSTSHASTELLSSSNRVGTILCDIGPLQAATPKKPSNRGRKPMRSMELTSPDNLATLKEKRATPKKGTSKRKSTTTKTVQITSKRGRKEKKSPSPSSSSEDDDFCIICLEKMPKKTVDNSVACNICKREVHLKCANMTRSYFTCVHCDSDFEDEEG